MLPVTDTVYDFQTDLETDTFVETTAVAATTANLTLSTAIHDNDTDTITITSDTSDDSPLYSAYNTTTRALDITGLAANTTRTLTVTYDIYALAGGDAIETLTDRIPLVWLLTIIAFPMAAIAAIWVGRV